MSRGASLFLSLSQGEGNRHPRHQKNKQKGSCHTENTEELQKRLRELDARAFSRGVYVCSDFLTLYEQDTLLRMKLSSPVQLLGGCEAAERKLALFGSEALCGYAGTVDAVWLCIAPRSVKFAQELKHRDFLGALMSLGVKREKLGDIVVRDSTAWLFCKETVAPFLAEELREVKATPVTVTQREEAPDFVSAPPTPRQVVVASERMDALIAAVYSLSRAESQRLIAQEKVFCAGRLIRSASETVGEGAVISVRGYGRFAYGGIERETKRGRLRANVAQY